jgi:cytochrome c553
MVAHHRSPESKKHSPSALSRRANKWWEVLVAELLKCSPLCATCHAVVHDVMDDHYPSVDDEQWAYIVQQARADIANWERADGR